MPCVWMRICACRKATSNISKVICDTLGISRAVRWSLDTFAISWLLRRKEISVARRKSLATIPLVEEAMMVVLPSGHRFASRYALPLAERKDELFVLHSRELGPDLYDEIIEACRHAGFEPQIGQVAPQITSIANLVAVELGVSVVPAPVSNINVPGVVFVPILGNEPRARLALVTHQDDHSMVTENFRKQVRTSRARSARLADPAEPSASSH